MMNNVPIVILNGGKSSRMGTDKSDLKIGGQTLLNRAIALASTVGDHVYVSGNSSGENILTLPDLVQEIGPMGGILGAMNFLSDSDHVLFIPVDMPFIQTATLMKMVENSVSRSCVLMDIKGSVIPVVATYNRMAEKVFKDCVQAGDFSLQRALRKIDYIPITVKDPRESLNINTPEDFRLISEL